MYFYRTSRLVLLVAPVFVTIACAQRSPSLPQGQRSSPPSPTISSEDLISEVVETICSPELERCCVQESFGFDLQRCRSAVRSRMTPEIDKRLRGRSDGYLAKNAAGLVRALKRAVSNCGTGQDAAIMKSEYNEALEDLFVRGKVPPFEHCETLWDCAVTTPDGKRAKGGANHCINETHEALIREGGTCVPFYPAKDGACEVVDAFATKYCTDEGTFCDHDRCVPVLPVGADCTGREYVPNICGGAAFCGNIRTPNGVKSVCQRSPRRGEPCDEQHICHDNLVCLETPAGPRCLEDSRVVTPVLCGFVSPRERAGAALGSL
jgi:hypothetical protein